MEVDNNRATPIDLADFSAKASGMEDKSGKKASDLLALSRVSAAVSSRMDLDDILQVCLDNIIGFIDGVAGGIMLLDEQTETLSYRVYYNLSATYAEEMRLKLGEGIAGKVAQSGRPMWLEDVSLEPSAARPDLIKMEGLRAILSVPIRAKNNILGVMNVASYVPGHFTERDRHLLYSMGDLIGIAVEQSRLSEQVRTSRERYRDLAQQMLKTQEKARKWVARELHDETSQSLSGLSMQLQALIEMSRKSGQDTEFIGRLEKVHDATVQIHTEISRLIANLHPPLLDTLGLVPAVRQHAESSLRHLDINVAVEARGRIRPLPPETEIELFRFAQGAIANIAQHSRAKNATIFFEYLDDELLLEISDDGQGFDITGIKHIEEDGRGRGVFSMRERINILGGTMYGKSQPGQGTTVSARVPASYFEGNAEDKSAGG